MENVVLTGFGVNLFPDKRIHVLIISLPMDTSTQSCKGPENASASCNTGAKQQFV
jgi:hypothetical protein